MKKAKRIIVWFRQDLRLHDNEALTRALERGEEIIPIYVFDERQFGQTPYGFPKTGAFRSQFLIECVEDLRNSFQKLGIDLIVRYGKPEEEVFKIAAELHTSWVFANRERTHEEVLVQNRLEKKLWTIGQELHFFRGKMLYYTQDLPFPISQAPEVFTTFRKEVERYVPIREPLQAPQSANFWTFDIQHGAIPTLADLGHQPIIRDERTAFPFRGGETHGLNRLQSYFWKKGHVCTYEKTRNGLLGTAYSTKFSPWLAQGCLSPKYIFAELQRYEQEQTKNKSTYWLFFELLWRDFFRLMGKKHKNKIFQKNGIKGQSSKKLQDNWSAFQQWADGKTNIPFVDASMTELKLTGYLSNRSRQNVASYLINDLQVNWQIGAEYFESLLVDYDVCSNWVNWMYLAGVGNDPRTDRYFDVIGQAKRYDPQGEYVKLWLPHLRDISSNDIHDTSTWGNPQLQG